VEPIRRRAAHFGWRITNEVYEAASGLLIHRWRPGGRRGGRRRGDVDAVHQRDAERLRCLALLREDRRLAGDRPRLERGSGGSSSFEPLGCLLTPFSETMYASYPRILDHSGGHPSFTAFCAPLADEPARSHSTRGRHRH
jgi:hypothetical protein